MFQGSQPKVLEREEAVASHCQKRTQESEPIIFLSFGTFLVAGQVERKSILTESVGERRPSKSALVCEFFNAHGRVEKVLQKFG